MCRQFKNISKKTFWKPERLIFLNKREASLSGEELAEHEISEDVMAERRRIEGFYMTHPLDLAIERERLRERLGVDRVTAGILERQRPDQQLQDVILQQRVNEELGRIIKEREAHESKVRPWYGNAGQTIAGFVGKYYNPFILADYITQPDQRSVFDELRLHYGESKNIAFMLTHAGNELGPTLRRITQQDRDQLGQILGHPAAGITINQLTNLLGQASLAQLENIRHFQAQNNTEPFDQNRAFESLLILRRVESRERSKMLGIMIFDTGRLSNFADSMRRGDNDTFRILTEQILEPNALNNLDKNHSAKALLAHLLYMYENAGGAMSMTMPLTPQNAHALDTLRTELERIRDNLPATTKADEAAEKPQNIQNAEKMEDCCQKLAEARENLLQFYNKIPAVTARINTLIGERNQQMIAIQAIPNQQPGAPVNDTARAAALNTLNKINQKLNDLADRSTTLTDEVNAREKTYKSLAKELSFLVRTSADPVNPPQAPPANQPNLTAIHQVANHDLSTEGQLFSAVHANLQQHVQNTAIPAFFEALRTEIESNYTRNLKGRQRISACHLLILLNERGMENAGETDAGRRQKKAVLLTNLAIADAKTVDMERHGNREDAEKMIGGLRGLLRKSKNYISSKFYSSNTFAAAEIIEGIVADEKFSKFAELKADFSLTDLREYLNGKAITTAELAEFYTHLERAMKEYKVADLKTIMGHLLTLHAEIETREFMETVANPPEEDQKLSKADYFRKLLQKKEASEKTLLVSLKKIKTDFSWRERFNKIAIRTKWLTKLVEAEKHCRKEKLKGEAKKKYLSSQGIPGIAVKILQDDAIKTIKKEEKMAKKAAKKAYKDAKAKEKEAGKKADAQKEKKRWYKEWYVKYPTAPLWLLPAIGWGIVKAVHYSEEDRNRDREKRAQRKQKAAERASAKEAKKNHGKGH